MVCLFSPEGQCFYGDPLKSVQIPANLPETLNPYYKARFGKDLTYIFNCSVEEKFPNFPRQCSDAHCCGYVCLLVMMLAKEPKFLEYILSSKTIKGGPRFLKYPGYYPEFLKQLFQMFSKEKDIKLPLIICRQDVKNIVIQVGVWKTTPFLRDEATKASKQIHPYCGRESEILNKDDIPARNDNFPAFKKVISEKTSVLKETITNCENNNISSRKSPIPSKNPDPVPSLLSTGGSKSTGEKKKSSIEIHVQSDSEKFGNIDKDEELVGNNAENESLTVMENSVKESIFDGTYVGTLAFIGAKLKIAVPLNLLRKQGFLEKGFSLIGSLTIEHHTHVKTNPCFLKILRMMLPNLLALLLNPSLPKI